MEDHFLEVLVRIVIMVVGFHLVVLKVDRFLEGLVKLILFSYYVLIKVEVVVIPMVLAYLIMVEVIQKVEGIQKVEVIQKVLAFV